MKEIIISSLTQRIPNQGDLINIFIKQRHKYNKMLKSKQYKFEYDLLCFLNQYSNVSFINKEYFLKQYQKYIKDLTDFQRILKDTLNETLSWQKRKWTVRNNLLEQFFVCEYNNKNISYSVIGKRFSEKDSWKMHMTLEVNDNECSVPGTHKYYKMLYSLILKSVERSEKNNNSHPKVSSLKKHIITSNDFVVRTNVFKCISEKHHLEEVIGIIKVLTPSGKTSQETVTAAYCSKCKCYFLILSEYQRISKKGVLICKMIEKEYFYKHGVQFSHMETESILMQNGYNVKATIGLTDLQRQIILANIIDQHILTASQIISYLQMFIAQKKGLYSYQNAVNKWEADLHFVRLYKNNNKKRMFVNSLTKSVYLIKK